jgi:hypothetical protein
MPPKNNKEVNEAYAEFQSVFVSPQERVDIAERNNEAYAALEEARGPPLRTPPSSVKSKGSRGGGSASGGRGLGIFQQKVQAKGGIHDSHNKGARYEL